MLKWIASGCLVIIVLFAVLSYAGYRKVSTMAETGPSVSVSIKATPERVFASLSHSDSLPTWLGLGTTLRSKRPGTLAVGDSIFVTTRGDSVPQTAWIVDTVVPGSVIAMRWVMLEARMVVHRRRDSVSAAGDSTRVTSTIAAAMADSLRAARGRAGGVSGGLIDMASTFGTASAKMQAEQELRRLKAHIEGAPVVRP